MTTSEEKMAPDRFMELCAALPPDTHWGDAITPEIVAHIWQAALQQGSEAGAVGYIDEEGIFISVKAYNKVINVFKCLYTPVFLAPPSAQAIETAAIMKCVEVVRSLGKVKDSAYVEAFLALITQDGRTQLEQKCMEAQERTEKCIRDYFAFKSSMHPAQMQDLINELRRMAESDKTTMEGEKGCQ